MKLYVLEEAELADAPGGSFFLDLLSDSDLRRYHSIRTPKRRHQFLLGRALLAYVRDREGVARTARVSISHHGNHACAALVDNGRIGVDVHTCSLYPQVVARRFFTPGEYRWLQELPETSRPRAFGMLWSIKEAVCKARGTGLRFPLPEVNVPLDREGRCEDLRWALMPLDVDIVSAVAYEGTKSVFQHEWVVRVEFPDLRVGNGSAH